VYTDEKTGRVLRVEGDPESPQTHGRLCAKGLAASDLVTNPARLTKPLKRVGERGEGKFVEISWDEALDTIARNMLSSKEKFGPQSVAMLEGTRRGWSRIYSRLAYSFGTPNHGAAGWAQCLWPRLIDINLTFGRGMNYPASYDFPHTDCILCWGMNPAATWGGGRAGDIMEARQRSAALIVVDPYLSETAAKADVWLNLRPGTDTALALTMLHIIFAEHLQDQEFLDRYTFGAEALKEAVAPYTVAWGSRITGVDEKTILQATHWYAQAESATLCRCLALDQQQDSIQACRAVSALIVVTGNLGRPGTNVLCSKRGDVPQSTLDFIRFKAIPPEVQKLRCGYDAYPLLTQELSPVPSMHMPTFWEQVMTGKPYPIPCALIFGSNAKVIYTNASYVEQALGRFKFLAVCDLFMTPTAKMADIVLPASSWLERDNVISSFQSSNTCTLIQQKVTSVGESRDDVDIVCELAQRLGVGEFFWKNATEFYNFILAPANVTLEQAKVMRRLYAPQTYGEYIHTPFKTPSGKIELYSTLAERKGCYPLLHYTPSFQGYASTPDLANRYPLIITTGRHETAFRHTENRVNPFLLEMNPYATLDIHPETAKSLHIHDGQKVLVESTAGKAYAIARYTLGIRRDVVQGIAGWPDEQNINRTVPWGSYSEGVGSVCARGYLCRVTAVGDEA
jgi:anaerobic selenocysteine-containing dehydrogenase